VIVADESFTADEAYGFACQGVALLWCGDFQHARQMLNALARRADRAVAKSQKPIDSSLHRQKRDSKAPAQPATGSPEAFHAYRQARSQRARTLGSLLIPLNEDYTIPLRRAPDVRQACMEAFGPGETASITSLRALLGVIGAHEWRKKGIEIPAVGGRIHPHYGVFAPIRREYVDLVSTAPLPAALAPSSIAFDIGTGTGVLAAVLACRGIERVIATDLQPRALACARENLERLGLAQRVEVVEADLFPSARAALVVCNPPWIPARPTSAMEAGIYDADGQMLRGFLAGLLDHLEPGGEGWLILSDIAEHLGLRTRAQLLADFETAGLRVVDRIDVSPSHPRAADKNDPLYAARSAEITSLWRLASAPKPPGD
jgi:SAM-dependent methyltransferase